MAAKAKAPTKAKVTPVSKVQSKAKAKPKGLQLSSAQFKAYNKAFSASRSAAYQRIAFNAAVNRFRKYRLQAAYSTIKKFNVYNVKVQTAAIAAAATRQSYRQSRLAHQNAALEARIKADNYTHQNLAGRLQFGQAGERAYVNRAVMRTVDTTQAKSYEAKIFAAAARAAKSASKSVRKRKFKGRNTISAAQKAKINAAAATAGLRAAEQVKPSAKAKRGRPKGVKNGQGGQQGLAANRKSNAAKGAKSAKAPVAPAKKRAALVPAIMWPRTFLDRREHMWITGYNEFDSTCVMTAIANAILHQTNYILPDTDILYWTGRLGENPTIPDALKLMYKLQPWPEIHMHKPAIAFRNNVPSIIGYKVDTGDHAAYAFGQTVISWGLETDMPAGGIEERWSCEFDLISLSRG